MCTIAGYAGAKQAAPILIDMLKREEYMDSGLSTGIATIHEGRLYTAKVLGDVNELLHSTDAIHFPGTVGIIHSRTSNNLLSHAHPFLSADEKLALVLNGTFREVNCEAFAEESNRIMAAFFEEGVVKTAYTPSKASTNPRVLPNGMKYHDSESYALRIGRMLEHSAPENMARDMAEATRVALSQLPGDIIILGVHQDLPDTVTVGTVTRPMTCGFGDGETYLATSAMAFPREVQQRPIVSIPPTAICQITPEGLKITNKKIDNVRVEQVDYRVAAYLYTHMEALLKGKKDDPVAIPDMPCYTDWREVWSQPSVDCKFANPTGLLKPYATVLYETLWSFHKEGRLHSRVIERKGYPCTAFWLED